MQLRSEPKSVLLHRETSPISPPCGWVGGVRTDRQGTGGSTAASDVVPALAGGHASTGCLVHAIPFSGPPLHNQLALQPLFFKLRRFAGWVEREGGGGIQPCITLMQKVAERERCSGISRMGGGNGAPNRSRVALHWLSVPWMMMNGMG